MIAQLDSQRLTLESMLPDVLKAWPSTRGVFDRYGLTGCGGRLGPVESVGFFARAHGVDEGQLLVELEAAAALPAVEVAPSACAVEDTIYRRYFFAGILLILTAGATWGAWLLWQIGVRGKFTGVSIHDVNAHGHAQIFGWMGLFIMGFAYQAFPRIWHTRLVAPKLAVASFALMVAGLVICPVAMTQAGVWKHAAGIALLGGALEIAAVTTFATQILLTFKRGAMRFEPYVGFVAAGLVWFVAMSGMSAWHTWNTMTAGSRDELLTYVKTYQAPLRDLQVHGLGLFMILGVCMRMLPGLFDLPRIADSRAWKALATLIGGVVGEVVIYIAYVRTGNHAIAALLMLPWAMLAAGMVMVAWPWKLWRPLPVSDRSGKFVRAAYGWLAVSMTMLLLLPVYQQISGLPFSHAYYGAIRHAITVGFISLMIMGIAAKVVPTLNGVDPRRLTALWGPFALVNVGCFLRVSTQTLTDWNPHFFAIVGVSGTLEVIGLAWWGTDLARIMLRGKRDERATIVDVPARPAPASIDEAHTPADVLEWFPATSAVFDAYGFTLLRHGMLLRTIGRTTTLVAAARLRGIELTALLRDLNAAAGLSAHHHDPLPIDVPIRQVAREHPEIVPALNRLGLDTCCSGERTFSQVAATRGVSLDSLLMELSADSGCDGRGHSCGSCGHN